MIKKPHIGQTIAWYFALSCYFAAIFCLATLGYLYDDYDRESAVIPSLAATSVFFFTSGLVLHVIARTDLPDLEKDRDRFRDHQATKRNHRR